VSDQTRQRIQLLTLDDAQQKIDNSVPGLPYSTQLMSGQPSAIDIARFRDLLCTILIFLFNLSKVSLLRVHYRSTSCSQRESQESTGNDILDTRRGEGFPFSITDYLDKNISKSLAVSVQSSVIAKLHNMQAGEECLIQFPLWQ
jgi:hypothetical protein